MPEKREPTKTLVRGPDGTLWLLSEDEAPIKLSTEQNKEVEKIIDDCEEKLSCEVIETGVKACVGVHIGVSNVFLHHGPRSGEGQKP